MFEQSPATERRTNRMKDLSIPYRLLRAALVIVSLAIIVGTVATAWQALVEIRTLARTAPPIDVVQIRSLCKAILVGSTLAILMAVALGVAAMRLRSRSWTRAMIALLPKYGFRGLLCFIAVVAIAVQFPMATLTATTALPVVMLLVVGAIAGVCYSAMLGLKTVRGTKTAHAGSLQITHSRTPGAHNADPSKSQNE
jgi:hypothetical protein